MADNSLLYDNFKLVLDGRQESAVRRFTECQKAWGILLLHKVGTGKTITSLLIAMNTFRRKKPYPCTIEKPYEIVVIAPVGIYNGFVNDLTNVILFNDGNIVKNSPKSPEDSVYKFFDIYVKLINYDFDKLIADMNRKKNFNYENKIVIIDEAHRLLTNDIFNSIEAAGAMKKHSLIDDIIFREVISKSLRIITMSGTPMQQSPADLCKFGNFLTKSNEFSLSKYAAKRANLVWVTFMIKQIDVISNVTSIFAGLAYTALTAAAATATGPITLTSFGIGLAGALAIGAVKTGADYLAVGAVKRNIAKKLKEEGIKSGGNKHSKRRVLNKNNKTNKKLLQYGGGENEEFLSQLAVLSVDQHVKFLSNMVSKVPNLVFDKLSSITNVAIKNAPTEIGKGVSSVASDFLVFSAFNAETIDTLNVITEPVFDIKLLASNLSPIISIYDYELQNTLNLACHDELTQVLKNNGINENYEDIAKVRAGSYEQNKKILTEMNEIKRITTANFAKIKEKKPKCNINSINKDGTAKPTDDSTIDTRFPQAIELIKTINYEQKQIDLITDFCINLLSDEDKDAFYLNKYEKISLNFKEKLDYFVNNMKFASSYSEDVSNYYSYLEVDGNDAYRMYSYKSRKGENKKQTGSPVFECEKFKEALLIIEDSNSNKVRINNTVVKEYSLHANELIRVNDDIYLKHPHGKYRNNTANNLSTDTEKIFRGEEVGGYYLPVVYSYNEDFGLGLFANYLTSKGKKYILVNKLQDGVRITDPANGSSVDLLEYNKKKAFSTVYNGDANDPVCVLIDPTMTEGLNATYNPCILVLEACNTFGDSEQVYGRVLRKYADSYINKKFKVVHQFITKPEESLDQIANLKVIRMKMLGRTVDEQMKKNNFLGFTLNEYKNAQASFRYISPDSVCFNKIKREKQNLANFESNVNFEIAYSDLAETLHCNNNSAMRGDRKIEINLNTTKNGGEDLFYTCDNEKHKNKILSSIEKVKKLKPAVMINLLRSIRARYDKETKDFSDAYDALVTIFNKEKNSRIENGTITYPRVEEITKTVLISGPDNDSSINYFISKTIDTMDIDKLITNATAILPTSFFSPASKPFFEAQTKEFEGYIKRLFDNKEVTVIAPPVVTEQEAAPLPPVVSEQGPVPPLVPEQGPVPVPKPLNNRERKALTKARREQQFNESDNPTRESDRNKGIAPPFGMGNIQHIFSTVKQTRAKSLIGEPPKLSNGQQYAPEDLAAMLRDGKNFNFIANIPLTPDDISKIKKYLSIKGGYSRRTRKNYKRKI